MTRAVARLLLALPIVGAGVAAVLRSGLGAAPWDVLHVGLAEVTGSSVGAATTLTAAAAVIVARRGGVRPGPGTLLNVVLLGLCVDAALWALPPAPTVVAAVAYLGVGMLLLGAGTGLFLSAALGSGPRDSLMLAIAGRRGFTLVRARTAVELAALALGLVLGGHAGPGTLIFATTIGPVVRWGITLFGEAPC
jgi:uncharacterized membrane protein YczE